MPPKLQAKEATQPRPLVKTQKVEAMLDPLSSQDLRIKDVNGVRDPVIVTITAKNLKTRKLVFHRPVGITDLEDDDVVLSTPQELAELTERLKDPLAKTRQQLAAWDALKVTFHGREDIKIVKNDHGDPIPIWSDVSRYQGGTPISLFARESVSKEESKAGKVGRLLYPEFSSQLEEFKDLAQYDSDFRTRKGTRADQDQESIGTVTDVGHLVDLLVRTICDFVIEEAGSDDDSEFFSAQVVKTGTRPKRVTVPVSAGPKAMPKVSSKRPPAPLSGAKALPAGVQDLNDEPDPPDDD